MIATLSLITRFPRAYFHPEWRVLTWHPVGVLDEKLADRVRQFLELREKIDGEPFHRYTDMTGFTKARIGLSHVVRLARQRHSYKGPPVKSAIHASGLVSLTIAQMYAELMKGSRVQVSTFRSQNTAAQWLKVPRKVLEPPPGPPPPPSRSK